MGILIWGIGFQGFTALMTWRHYHFTKLDDLKLTYNKALFQLQSGNTFLSGRKIEEVAEEDAPVAITFVELSDAIFLIGCFFLLNLILFVSSFTSRYNLSAQY